MTTKTLRTNIALAATLLIAFVVAGCGGLPGMGYDWQNPTTDSTQFPEPTTTTGTGTPDTTVTSSPTPVADNGTGYLSSVLLDGKLMRWTKTNLTVSMDTSNTPADWRPEYANHVTDGLQQWANALNNQISFTLTTGSADISIKWVSSVEGASSSVTGVTRTWYNSTGFFPPTIELGLYAASHRLSNHTMHVTAVHELGHALGMQGHSPYQEDLMYYASNASTLTSRDVSTIQQMYSATPDYPEATAGTLGVRGGTLIEINSTLDEVQN